MNEGALFLAGGIAFCLLEFLYNILMQGVPKEVLIEMKLFKQNVFTEKEVKNAKVEEPIRIRKPKPHPPETPIDYSQQSSQDIITLPAKRLRAKIDEIEIDEIPSILLLQPDKKTLLTKRILGIKVPQQEKKIPLYGFTSPIPKTSRNLQPNLKPSISLFSSFNKN